MRIAASAALTVAFCLWITPAQAAVVAHYSFDSDFTDISGSGHDGTANNASLVTIDTANSKFGGGSASFANTVTPVTNAYVSLAASPIQFATNTAYAISFWARPTDSTPVNDGGMILGDPANTKSFVWLDEGAAAGGGLRLRSALSTSNVNADFPFSLTPIRDGSFHHFALMVSDLDNDGNNNDVSLWVDNVLKTPVKNMTNSSLDIKAIGQGYTTALNVAYKGQIDELWIFNSPLTSTDVSNLYTANAVPEPTSLLGAIGVIALAFLRRSPHR